MNLRPFRTKRRPKRAEFWGLVVESDINPPALGPADAAQHEVMLQNKDTIGYKLTVKAHCGPLLRYGSDGQWGPHERMLSPEQKSPLNGTLDLPSACDATKLPCWEQVVLKADATPFDPMIKGQTASIFHDVNLTK